MSFRDRAFEETLKFNSFTVGRAKFDRWFAEQAKSRGAFVVPATVVTDLLRDGDGRVIGVRTDRPDGDVHARVVLLADGINSPLAAKTGFRPEAKPEHVALAVKDVVELPEEAINERFHVEAGSGVTIEVLGAVTKGMDGIGVIYTNKNSLSVAIGANLSDFMTHKVKPYEMLEEFKSHPKVAPLAEGRQAEGVHGPLDSRGRLRRHPPAVRRRVSHRGRFGDVVQRAPPGGVEHGHDVGPLCRGGHRRGHGEG